MTRTTVVLPDEIKDIAVRNAHAEGISFGEFVRRSLENSIRRDISEKESYSRRHDSLFSGMRRMRQEATPGVRDGALNHDEYLYGSGHDQMQRKGRKK